MLIVLIEFWRVPENQRKFFELFAKDNHFDSFNPDHWYSQPRAKILSAKVNHIFII